MGDTSLIRAALLIALITAFGLAATGRAPAIEAPAASEAVPVTGGSSAFDITRLRFDGERYRLAPTTRCALLQPSPSPRPRCVLEHLPFRWNRKSR
jgi:hypothetical protein